MFLFKKISQYKSIIFILITVLLALLLEKNSRIELNQDKEFARVEKIIHSKIDKVDKTLSKMKMNLDSNTLDSLMLDHSFLQKDLYKNEGIVYLGYKNDTLVFWTDNSVPVDNYKIDKYLCRDVAKLKSGWYIIRHYQHDNNDLFGLILIKNEYGFQNEFIKSEFFYEYDLDISAKIKIDSENGYQIKDINGDYLFSFFLNSTLIDNYYAIYFSSLFYVIALLLLFSIIRKIFLNLKSQKLKTISLFLLFFLLIALRYLMLKYHFPDVFRRLDLFQPHHLAISFSIPSLGDLLLHAIFVFFFISLYNKFFNFKLPGNNIFKYTLLVFFITVIFFLSVIINY